MRIGMTIAATMHAGNIATQSTLPKQIRKFVKLRLHINIFTKNIECDSFSESWSMIFQGLIMVKFLLILLIM